MKVTINEKTNEMTIVIPCEIKSPRLSASGKTLVVASSRGNKETEAIVNGKPVTVGVNAYISNR